MKQSGITRLFMLVCVAVLLAAYGVGLGVRKVRFAGVETPVAAAAKTERPESDKSEADADKGAASKPSEEVAAEPSEQADGEVAARPERPEGRGMGGGGMRERFQNMTEEERQEAMAQMRERGGRTRGQGGGGGGGGFQQLSEEDREKLRTEMEELGARAGEMSEEEMRQARGEIMQKYGITPRGGGGGGAGRRPGGRE